MYEQGRRGPRIAFVRAGAIGFLYRGQDRPIWRRRCACRSLGEHVNAIKQHGIQPCGT